eukprot:COSAG02_NODE_1114_length_14502_cov_140.830035_14_plen_62_part_00
MQPLAPKLTRNEPARFWTFIFTLPRPHYAMWRFLGTRITGLGCSQMLHAVRSQYWSFVVGA